MSVDRRFIAGLIDFLRVHQEEVLERWSEQIAHFPAPLSPALQRQMAKVFLSLQIAWMEGESEARTSETRGQAMEEAIQGGLTAADLSRAQIALKRAVIDALVTSYPGDRERLSATCALVETRIDEDLIAVSDLYYRARQRGLTGELKASMERYGTLVETMNEGVCRWIGISRSPSSTSAWRRSRATRRRRPSAGPCPCSTTARAWPKYTPNWRSVGPGGPPSMKRR